MVDGREKCPALRLLLAVGDSSLTTLAARGPGVSVIVTAACAVDGLGERAKEEVEEEAGAGFCILSTAAESVEDSLLL